LTAATLLLAVGATTAVLPMNNQSNSPISHMRELLLRDAWVHDVRLGPIAVESLVLVFRETGELSERVFDDTGIHDAAGKWKLEESDGSVILVLGGGNLRNKGRFTLKEETKDDAIELRYVGGEATIRFERRKGFRS
jgi:hypothetical protein